MTRDDIIRMAREAGIFTTDLHCATASIDIVERFAALVAAAERTACARHFQVAIRNAVTAEREDCAKVCDREASAIGQAHHAMVAGVCAAAIRARGQA